MDADGTPARTAGVDARAARQSSSPAALHVGGAEYGLTRCGGCTAGASLLLRIAANLRARLHLRLPAVRLPALERARERYGDKLVTERSFVCMAELLCKLAASSAGLPRCRWSCTMS